MSNNEQQESLFLNPSNFLLRLYNKNTEDEITISSDLLESFLNYKRTGVLIVKEDSLGEFMQDNNDTTLLDKLYIHYNNGIIKNYSTQEEFENNIADIHAIKTNNIILTDVENTNLYELYIKDGIIQINSIN